MEIVREIKNELLKRKEIEASMSNIGNPGVEATLKMLASKFNAPEEHIVVNTIKNRYGMNVFDVRAYIYDSLEAKSRLEKVKKKPVAEESRK